MTDNDLMQHMASPATVADDALDEQRAGYEIYKAHAIERGEIPREFRPTPPRKLWADKTFRETIIDKLEKNPGFHKFTEAERAANRAAAAKFIAGKTQAELDWDAAERQARDQYMGETQ